MYGYCNFVHEVTDDIVQIVKVEEGNKVHCIADFGNKKQRYVFQVDAENANELKEKISELEESSSEGESSEELSVIAFAPNSNSNKFRNIKIVN